MNKSYNEPAVAKANLPAAIQDNKKKKPLKGRGNIGKTFHERADSFTHTNAKNEVTNRKKKEARRKEQEKKDESSFTDMMNKYKSLEGMKAKFPLKTMVRNGYATPKVTKYQRCIFIIQIHQFTVKIDKININLLFECVKIVEFNFNFHVFHVMYQETRFLNQDACFLNQEGRRQFLISFVSERD